MKMLFALTLAAAVAMPWAVQAKEYEVATARPRGGSSTDQIIVKWRGEAQSLMADPAAQRANKLSSAAGVTLQHKRSSSADTEVFKLGRSMQLDELQSVLERLNADPAVEFAVADQRRWVQAQPTDPLFLDQWYFRTVEPAATRAETAWDTTTGSSATVVAVLDTGVRYLHPDLGRVATGGKLLPGYDFITQAAVANDGDGRDADATDTGDWVDASDRAQSMFSNCDLSSSSWHGTRVSSLIGALTNETVGMAGTGWTTLVLPVRVLGKCGGFDSDIIDGIRWSAGLAVAGAPLNPTPAKIINLSLGGDGPCSAAYQTAINEATATGSLIVASVGNDGNVVSSPANCNNVIGVSGVRHIGTKVGYSNLGVGADIAAPAGNCVNPTVTTATPCLYPLLVATDSGTTAPLGPTYTDKVLNLNIGTSFAAPLVAGAAALMNAVNPRLTPAQYATLLQESATPFPTTSPDTTTICRSTSATLQGAECICTTTTCGAGMLNTASAVAAALKPFGIVLAPATIDTNVNIPIDGTTSFDVNGNAVASYAWSIANVTGATPTIAAATTGVTTLQVPGNSRFTLSLRVTDTNGATDDTNFAMVTTTSPDPPPAPPATSPIGPRGNGGGGSFDWWLLVLGLLPLALPGPRRRKPARVRSRSTPRNSTTREIHEATGLTSRSHRRRRRQHFPQ